jgi:hypothetical protein
MSNVVKECKTNCKAIGKKCNKSTGRCRKRTNKDSPSVSPKKASSPKASSPKASSPKAPSPKASSPKASSPKASSPKASSPQVIKIKPCKEDCSIVTSWYGHKRKCNYETGRCKIVPPEKPLLTEDDCTINERLNETRTRCVAIPYLERYRKLKDYKVYFEVKPYNIKRAQELGAKWDKENKKMYYTIEVSLGNVMKLNYMSLVKPKKIYLNNVPYSFRHYAHNSGANWDAKEKKWYFFDNLPAYNKYMLKNTDWKHFSYRIEYEMIY